MANPSKNLARGSNAVIYTLLAIGILVLVYILALRVPKRVDLTENQVFTISQASRDMVRKLPDRLTIKAFISSDLPAQVKSHANYLKDILLEYQEYSEGRVHYEQLDPSRDEKIKDEARRLKVRSAQLSVYEKTKASVSESYLGVAFMFGGKVESIPFVTDVANLEYEISSTIRRLTSKKKKVGITSGHGEPNTYQGLRAVQQQLKDYDVSSVDLKEGKNPIPDDLDVLIVAGPTQPFAPRAKYELDQHLMRGKSLAVLVDGMTLETPRGQMPQGQAPPRIARANQVGLKDQLEYYGAKVGHDLIFDKQNARVVLPAGGGRRVFTNYPGFPVVTNFNKSNPITRDMQGLIPIFPSSVDLTKMVTEGKSGVTGTVLASSSDGSWRQTGFFLFDPLRQPKPTKEKGPFPLAVYAQGTFKSFFAGREVPKPGPAKPMQEKKETPKPDGKKAKASARLVVVGDSDFVKDEYLGLNPANLMLLLNMVDVLAQDTMLISIRAKTQTRRPLEAVDEGTITMATWGNVVGVPLIFVIFGVARWRWRRVTRRHRAAKLLGGNE